jgi:MarR family transcriptional regulator for hemolysin
MVLRTWKSRAGDRLKPLGITPSKCAVLWQLVEAGGVLPQRELVVAVGVEKATLTRLLESMEAEGWVVRESGAADRRVKSVAITDAGKALVPKARAVFDQLFEEALSGSDASQGMAAADFLGCLLERLRALRPAGSPGIEAEVEAE